MPEYAYDNAIPIQQERLRTLEALLDAGTIRELEARGVRSGWDCLEVGAGGGSIAAWLCERVAPEGSVLATDLDTRHLTDLSQPNLAVREHDLFADALPERAFDLIHLRLVLAWLADREEALRRLRDALRPDGWLLVEEMDFESSVPDPHMGAETCACFARVVEGHNEVLARRSGFDAYYGRRVVADLEQAGLVDVGGEGRASMWRGGEAGGRIWALSLAQLRESLLEEGLASPSDLDATLELVGEPRFSAVSPVVMAAWGRRGG